MPVLTLSQHSHVSVLWPPVYKPSVTFGLGHNHSRLSQKAVAKSEPIVKIPVQDSFQKCFANYWRGNPESSVSVSLATKSVEPLRDLGRNRKEGQISAGSHVPFFFQFLPFPFHIAFLYVEDVGLIAIIWRCYLWHCQEHDHRSLTVKAEEADF